MYSIETPVSRQVPDGYRELVKPYDTTFTRSNDDGLYRVQIERGFTWRPSVPKFAESVTSRDDLYPAALVHDWMYRYRGNLLYEGLLSERVANGHWRRITECTRADADAVFLDFMRHTNVHGLRRTIAYAVVRALGRWIWNDRQELPQHITTAVDPSITGSDT